MESLYIFRFWIFRFGLGAGCILKRSKIGNPKFPNYLYFMEPKPTGILLFLGMVFFFATIFSMGIVILLSYLKVVRIKRPGEYFIWGVVGGIFISFIYVTLMCNKSSEPVTAYQLPVTGNL